MEGLWKNGVKVGRRGEKGRKEQKEGKGTAGDPSIQLHHDL